MEKCPFLNEYMIFVDYVRENHRINGYEYLEHSIETAIDRCINEDILRDFLIEHRSEVVKVVKLDYTFDRQLMLEREDSRAEGREEGRKEGREEGREEGRKEGRKEGREEGREEMANEMTELAIHLINAGRANEIERCKDSVYRNTLLKEFHLIS